MEGWDYLDPAPACLPSSHGQASSPEQGWSLIHCTGIGQGKLYPGINLLPRLIGRWWLQLWFSRQSQGNEQPGISLPLYRQVELTKPCTGQTWYLQKNFKKTDISALGPMPVTIIRSGRNPVNFAGLWGPVQKGYELHLQKPVKGSWQIIFNEGQAEACSPGWRMTLQICGCLLVREWRMLYLSRTRVWQI